MAETVLYRHFLDSPPTQNDRLNKIGINEFAKKLREKGWVAEDGDTAIRNFHVTYSGWTEDGKHYMEYKATLKD